MTALDQPSAVEQEDHLVEQAVLELLLDAHPGQRSIEEVVREMADGPGDHIGRDHVANAIRELVSAGLLHRHGSFVFATRAATRFDDLRT